MPSARIMPSKPAMILQGQKKSLVVADIHLGFENSFLANRISVGKNSSILDTITELTDLIQSERPENVILLGDIKSGTGKITGREWDDVPLFFKLIQKQCDIILIPGNHDAHIRELVPKGISMIGSAGMIDGNVLFTHGHTMPPQSFAHVDKIIMGHVHPVFLQEDSVLNGQRVWVHIKTEKQDIFPDRSGKLEIIIMPSFNKYLYATHKRSRSKSISPIIGRIKNIITARIMTLDGTIIGDESMLKLVI